MPNNQRTMFADAGSQPASAPQPPAAEPASRPASRGRKVAPAPRSTRISPPVLAALRGAVVGHDHVDLGVQQLPRHIYIEAAAVLETVGAKWHTGRKRHLFTQTWDPGMFADVLETGEAPPANPLSYFATPKAVALDLLGARQLRAAICNLRAVRVLEPSAGTGALALEVARFWAEWAREQTSEATLELVLVEVDPRRCKILRATLIPQLEALLPGRIVASIIQGDFINLAELHGGKVDAIVMNPPFSLPGDRCAWWSHLRHAFRFLHPWRGVVGCVAPLAWRHQQGPEMLEAIEAISKGVAWDFGKGAFKDSGTGIGTSGIVIEATALEADADTYCADAALEANEEYRRVVDPAARRALEASGYRGLKDADPRLLAEAPEHDNPRSLWRRTILELTLAVARSNGGEVSFSEPYQRELSRLVWCSAVDRMGST